MSTEPSSPIAKEISQLEMQIYEMKQKVNQLTVQLPAEEIKNYALVQLDGSNTSLLELFAEKEEMILIHNMGPDCNYCTLWADGFKGYVPYLNDRCAFVLEMDIEASALKTFAEQREWNFTCVSSKNLDLKQDMGFSGEHDGKKSNMPGYSTLFREGEKIFRHSMSPFGPGDDYCMVWPMLNRLKNGINGWQPKRHK